MIFYPVHKPRCIGQFTLSSSRLSDSIGESPSIYMHAARAKILIRGRVQGVFYRHSTRQEAGSLGLSGWVRNLADGSVEIEAAGSKEKVESLIAWCHKGPPNAVVNSVQVEWQPVDSEQAGEPDTTGGAQGTDGAAPSFEIR